MNNIVNTKKMILDGKYDNCLCEMYSCMTDSLDPYRKRFLNLADTFENTFGDCQNVGLFSAPGRTEICGNHTDHQLGKVIAASVNLDVIAVAAPNNSGKIRIKSEGFDMDEIDLSNLSPKKDEVNTSAALIRGIAFKFCEMGYEISGFDAVTSSDVLKGSGLSSSAAFEVLVGVIINSFFANDEISDVEIASIGQFAENAYFGKPCGLMDQMASSVGGIISIDFSNPQIPLVEKINYDFKLCGYALCIIESGGDHSDLTDEYAAITSEMKAVSEFFGKSVLSEVNEYEFYSLVGKVREKCGDRAVLRAMHFFDDNNRVEREVNAIKDKNFSKFLKEVNHSGLSSYMKLQNVYVSDTPKNQPVSVVYGLCERFLGEEGAYRIQGGGFGGTVQAFVPQLKLMEFLQKMENSLWKGCCHVLTIRSVGGLKLKAN